VTRRYHQPSWIVDPPTISAEQNVESAQPLIETCDGKTEGLQWDRLAGMPVSGRCVSKAPTVARVIYQHKSVLGIGILDAFTGNGFAIVRFHPAQIFY
jgi:hypothetical protein